MNIFIDTCVLPHCHLETGRIYREKYGPGLGFELLVMFDLPDFEENLKQNLDLFAEGPLTFHEPVWGVEHSAPKGSPAYEEGMYHLRLTKKYADILHPSAMVFHLNNGMVPPGQRDRMLSTSLENLEEIRDLFPGTQILVENTGARLLNTQLLDQQEFTDLCRSRRIPVLIDVGHACMNGWDLRRLIGDLREQIRGYHLHNNNGLQDQHFRLRNGILDFTELIPLIDRITPDALKIIEYTMPRLHGHALLEDIGYLQHLSEGNPAARPTADHCQER